MLLRPIRNVGNRLRREVEYKKIHKKSTIEENNRKYKKRKEYRKIKGGLNGMGGTDEVKIKEIIKKKKMQSQE